MRTNKGRFKKGNVPWIKGRTHSQETRKKLSESNKSQTPWNKGKKGVQFPSAENLLKRSRSMKGKNRGPKSKEAKLKMSIARRGKKLSSDHKKSIAKGLRNSKIVNSPAYKEQQRQFRRHQVFPKKDSKPEKMMQIALTLQKIKFEKHVDLVGQPDIFIKPNVCLFIDGDYWHTNPKKYDSEKQMVGGKKAKYIWAKDNTINHDLNKNGFHVIRIWQSDIKKDTNKCSEKIITIIKQLVNSEKTVTIR